MIYTFKWFGPKDPTSLSFIKQTGAEEVVTSLADVKYGESWSISNIQKRQKKIQENKTIPGYSELGRMKGLAQLKGIIKGLEN